ncbi:MAG: glycosyltransferase family 4 protein [Bacteroidia bacterium]
MKILMIIAGPKTKASSRVRAYWLAEALKIHKVRCKLIHPKSAVQLFKLMFIIWKYRVVFFQKSYSIYDYYVLRIANAMGKTTILDIDDSPSKSNNPKTLANFRMMATHATAVFAGSKNLLYLVQSPQNNAYLIPSSILLKHYPKPVEKKTHDVCIGWIGNGAHYKDDLIQILYPALKAIDSNVTVKLKLVGASGQMELLNTFSLLPNVQLEIVDTIDWSNPTAVRAQIGSFDIGVYPLIDNDFNTYKCGFKALEYMALYIPVISSDVAINSSIIDHGNTGILASSKEEWTQALNSLINKPDLRKKMGEAGREKVENEFSMFITAQKVMDIVTKYG